MGDDDEAIEIIEETVSRSLRMLGEGHIDTLRASADRALIQRMAQREEVDLQPILSRMTDILGAAHPAILALHAGRLLHRVIDPQPF